MMLIGETFGKRAYFSTYSTVIADQPIYFAFKWIDKNFLYTTVISVSIYIFNSAIDARL
jgi:hypothetical protein